MDLAKAVAPGEVIGVDIAETDVQKARDAADAAAIRNVRFEVGDVYSYLEHADRFDVIYSNGMLEHLSDPSGVLAKALPALVPGGLIGVRTGDYGGFLIAPADPVLEAAMSLLYRVWQHNGGNPFIGRNLKSLLHTVGFTAIEGVASYQSHGTAPAIAWLADAMVNALSGPRFVKQVLDLGWAEPSHFERVRDAIGRWRNNPAAFAAVSWCAAIGVKQ